MCETSKKKLLRQFMIAQPIETLHCAAWERHFLSSKVKYDIYIHLYIIYKLIQHSTGEVEKKGFLFQFWLSNGKVKIDNNPLYCVYNNCVGTHNSNLPLILKAYHLCTYT